MSVCGAGRRAMMLKDSVWGRVRCVGRGETIRRPNDTCRPIPALVMTHRNLSTHMPALGKKSVVPQEPVTRPVQGLDPPPKTDVDLRLVQLLEKLSLVDFGNQEGIAVLEAAISDADQLSVVDTEGVEPMYTVLEDRCLPLSEDTESEVSFSEEVLACAHTLVDEYFVVPPGNITHTQKKDYHHQLEQQ